MANAKICDVCKKIIDDVSIKLTGYKVETKEKLGYEIEHAEEFCSFNCMSEYAKKQQEILDKNLEVINKYRNNSKIESEDLERSENNK